MKTFVSALLIAQAAAYPQVLEMLEKDNGPVITSRDQIASIIRRADNATQAASQARSNCGPHICTYFDAKAQFVSTSGEHEFRPPGGGDTRGVCPGLNAAANHDYLPRSGYPSIVDTITGLGAAYGMSVDLAGFLAAYAVIMDGDPLTLKWSIGGPMKGIPLLGRGQGINFSHNKYEGDTSITRPDIYIQGDNKGGVDLNKARAVIASGGPEGLLTIDTLRQVKAQNDHISITQNPNYFAPLFSTTLVAPAAYNFVINFMSNRSAEQPAGELTVENWKTFWALTGDGDSLTHHPGQERIPDNFYKRPIGQEYNAVDVFLDLIDGWLAYPDQFRFGGNTNGVDTYQGIDIATITGGQYTPENLFKGNNFACLVFQAQMQAVPDFLGGLLGPLLTSLQKVVGDNIAPLITSFGCPQLKEFDTAIYNRFPGSNLGT